MPPPDTPTGAFDRASVQTGQTISVSFGAMPTATSSPWSTHRSVNVSFNLLPLALAHRWWSSYDAAFSYTTPPPLSRLVPLGSGEISFANGQPQRYSFEIPNVPRGKYVIAYTADGAHWASARDDWQLDPHGILTVR
jgi:hypothetical protein